MDDPRSLVRAGSSIISIHDADTVGRGKGNANIHRRPDNCDGSYQQFCDQNRQYTNITAILQEKAPGTLQTMQTYWKDYQGDDESFWEHEFGKHGTCISTLEPRCYGAGYAPTDEVPDYFGRAVSLFQTLPTHDLLSAAGIVPSATQTYTLAAIKAALAAGHDGHAVVVRCSSAGELNELWYHFHVRGSVQSGDFTAVDPVGSGDTCPSTGVKYLPKYTTPPPPTSTSTTKTSTPTSTPTSTAIPTGTPGALSGKGYVRVKPDGFMISGGNWYRASGTPATFTATPDTPTTPAADTGYGYKYGYYQHHGRRRSAATDTFTLKTSKGLCAISPADSSLSCAAEVTAPTSFGYDGAYLTYRNSSAFYAAAAPAGQDKSVLFASPQAVAVQLYWEPR